MKKELLLAIIIGIVLGFSITGFFWAKKEGKLSFFSSTKSPSVEQNKKEATPTPTPTIGQKKETLFLEISEPENEAVVNQEELTIKGKTIANGTVIIIWEEGEDILVADENGEFSSEITLVGGENEIEISAYDNEGNQATKVLTITYSTAKF